MKNRRRQPAAPLLRGGKNDGVERHCFSTTPDRRTSSRLWILVTAGQVESIHCVQWQLGLSCKPDYRQPASGVFPGLRLDL